MRFLYSGDHDLLHTLQFFELTLSEESWFILFREMEYHIGC